MIGSSPITYLSGNYLLTRHFKSPGLQVNPLRLQHRITMSVVSKNLSLLVTVLLLTSSSAVLAQQLALPSGAGPATSGPTTTIGSSTYSQYATASSTFSAFSPSTTISVAISN